MNKWEKAVVQNHFDSESLVLKELEKQYKAALKDIDSKIAVLLQKDQSQSRIYQLEYQKTLRKQVAAAIDKLHADNYTSIEQYLAQTYTDGFVGTMYTLHAQGIPIVVPINQDSAVRAVLTDSKIKGSLYESLGVDAAKLKKSISSTIARGIASGETYDTITRALSLNTGAPLSRAKTIVRTEGHRIQQASADDARKVAVKHGAKVVKQWDAALDGSTRKTHRELDGQIRETEEPFEVAGKKAMFPGEFGDPAEDCNCRCVALTRAKWALDEDELATLKERAEYFELDKSDDFRSFENKYLKASNAESPRGDAQKVKPFVPAKNIEEAETFAKQFVDENAWASVGISYKGVGLDVANGINQSLDNLYSKFDVEKLGGIAAPAKNTKLGKLVTEHGGYMPIRKSLVFNRDNTKNIGTFVNGLLEDKRVTLDVLNHPEKYNMSKIPASVKSIVLASKKTGRPLVAETCEDIVTHEFGHHLQGLVTREQWSHIESNMAKYSEGISGYATANLHEYFAESFTSYMKGETAIDDYVRGIFDGWRK